MVLEKAVHAGVPDHRLATQVGQVVAGAAAGVQVQAAAHGQVAAVWGAGVDDVLALHRLRARWKTKMFG